jgi:hypothetical protein
MVDVKLEFFAIETGLHSLGKGIKIKDSLTAKQYLVKDLCEIYVKE